MECPVVQRRSFTCFHNRRGKPGERNEDSAKVVGEGNGSKEYSAAAYEVIKKMTATELDDLVQATKMVSEQE